MTRVPTRTFGSIHAYTVLYNTNGVDADVCEPLSLMANSNGEVLRLLTEIKESLEREVTALRQHMDGRFQRLEEKYDAQAVRLDRQGGLIRAGQTNIVRLNDWSEKIDQMLAARDKRIDALEARVRKLENE